MEGCWPFSLGPGLTADCVWGWSTQGCGSSAWAQGALTNLSESAELGGDISSQHCFPLGWSPLGSCARKVASALPSARYTGPSHPERDRPSKLKFLLASNSWTHWPRGLERPPFAEAEASSGHSKAPARRSGSLKAELYFQWPVGNSQYLGPASPSLLGLRLMDGGKGQGRSTSMASCLTPGPAFAAGHVLDAVVNCPLVWWGDPGVQE